MSIRIEHLTKSYDGSPVVSDLSLDIAEGELCVLLGPSGSGKSTVLRAVAGLAPVDAGRILLSGRDVTGLPPQKRDIGFVFQSYALFRHMTVEQNVGFALAVRGAPGAERRRRCLELLDMVGLAGFGSRMPSQLSGGQQQRVALARALAHRPTVLLLDEPFGALDARIRLELRRSLRQIQRELGITTVFVTHDQEEAFELADRIAVMARGRLMEVGPSVELYERPQTENVARFLGGTNLLVGETTTEGVSIGPVEVPLASRGVPGRRVQVLFRPEDVALSDPGEAPAHHALGVGTVEQATFAGPAERVRLRLPPFVGVRAIAPPVPFGADYFLVEASRSPHDALRLPLRPGDRARVEIRRVHVLTHPGMHFLVASDPSPGGTAAVALASTLARMAHARLTAMACGVDGEGAASVEGLRGRIGPAVDGLDVRGFPGGATHGAVHGAQQSPCDLVIVGPRPEDRARAGELILHDGQHHVLFAGQQSSPPPRVLLCTAAGEPGKHDVAFTGRLVRHLRAEAVVMTVLPREASEVEQHHAEHFLQAGARTLAPLGVIAQTMLRQGEVEEEIRLELDKAPAMLVIGAPLPGADRRVHLTGVVGKLLEAAANHPVLIIRGVWGGS